MLSDLVAEKALITLRGILDLQHEASEKKLHVFVDNFRAALARSCSWLLREATMQLTGSTLEGTAVSTAADYDILLVLPEPFTAEYFQVIKGPKPGAYMLRAKLKQDFHSKSRASENQSNSEKPEFFLDEENFLKVDHLKREVFSRLEETIQMMRTEHAECDLRSRSQCSTFLVWVNQPLPPVKIDIVPQIKANAWNICPNMLPFLPPCLDKLTLSDCQMFFTLDTENMLREFPEGHLLVSTSFSLLENKAMLASANVSAAVQLVKLTSSHLNWKKNFSLKGFNIKRVAIKHYEELHSASLWDGFQLLLKHLGNELWMGRIDGYFILGQDVYGKNGSKCQMLARHVKEALLNIKPSTLNEMVSELSMKELGVIPATECQEVNELPAMKSCQINLHNKPEIKMKNLVKNMHDNKIFNVNNQNIYDYSASLSKPPNILNNNRNMNFQTISRDKSPDKNIKITSNMMLYDNIENISNIMLHTSVLEDSYKNQHSSLSRDKIKSSQPTVKLNIFDDDFPPIQQNLLANDGKNSDSNSGAIPKCWSSHSSSKAKLKDDSYRDLYDRNHSPSNIEPSEYYTFDKISTFGIKDVKVNDAHTINSSMLPNKNKITHSDSQYLGDGDGFQPRMSSQHRKNTPNKSQQRNEASNKVLKTMTVTSLQPQKFDNREDHGSEQSFSDGFQLQKTRKQRKKSPPRHKNVDKSSGHSEPHSVRVMYVSRN